MPIYEYHSADQQHCDHCVTVFEVMQKISENPLKFCPHCHNPVQRKISRPSLTGQAPSLKEKNLAQHGFTQFRKVEKGVYEKTAGKGPDFITDKE